MVFAQLSKQARVICTEPSVLFPPCQSTSVLEFGLAQNSLLRSPGLTQNFIAITTSAEQVWQCSFAHSKWISTSSRREVWLYMSKQRPKNRSPSCKYTAGGKLRPADSQFGIQFVRQLCCFPGLSQTSVHSIKVKVSSNFSTGKSYINFSLRDSLLDECFMAKCMTDSIQQSSQVPH